MSGADREAPVASVTVADTPASEDGRFVDGVPRATNPRFWPYTDAMLVGATTDPPPAVLPIPSFSLPKPTTTALPAGTSTSKKPNLLLTVSYCDGDHVPSAATELPPSVM